MYIRTKTNIYKVVEEQIMCGTKFYHTGEEKISERLVNKEADTIEELLDEFVVVNNTCFNTPQLLGTEIDKDYYKHEEVYGAIWTNKGLIYVAKMNDKGELELI